MKIASWNINSVRLRQPLVQQFIREHPVDILCLQETKTPNEFFPLETMKNLGFSHVLYHGEKGYNGVAILSKIPLQALPIRQFGGIDHARHIAAGLPNGIELHNFYIPAGGDIPDPALNPKFAHKLQFVKDMTTWSSQRDAKSPAIILGDFNIAPLEHDVWSHKQLLDVVSHTPIEVELLAALQQSGKWVDTHRHFTPATEKLYSWWSYRAKDWEASNRGRRLDHLWVTPDLKDKLKACEIHKPVRSWQAPSDHVPIVTEFKE